MPAPTLNELIQQLQHGTDQDRYQAAHLLAGYPEPQAVTALSQALTSSRDPQLQDMAIKSLGRMGQPAFQVLLKALGDGHVAGHPRQAVRAVAAEALGKLQNAAAIEPLIQALKDVHPDVRKHAAGALIHYKDDRAVEALKLLLMRDPDPGVRSRAASVLQAMGITAPVNIPIIVTVSRPVSKPLPPSKTGKNSF